MPDHRCPGQDQRFWRADAIFYINCPGCHGEIEFWKDEPMRLCKGCGREVRNPRIDLGCAKWCRSAADCLGTTTGDAEAIASLRDRLIAAMQALFGADQRRIDHALKVLDYAEAIQCAEFPTASALVVKAAAILHDIGIQEAERKHGSAAGPYQELEGPPIARRILAELGVDAPTTEHVCRIVGSHHSAGDIDTPEFRAIWDADWLVNIPEEYPDIDREELSELIRCTFRTQRGQALAEEIFLK